MKKFMTLAAIAALMMSFSSCDEKTPTPNNPDKPNTDQPADVCPDCGKNPCECEPEYVSPITIDGDFSDWAALDASKVAVANCAADAKWTAMKTLKVYADEVYINIYFKVDADEITSDSPVDVYLDADGSATGVANNFANESAIDYLLEGAYYSEGAVVSCDLGLFAYGGTVEEFAWAFEPILEGGISTGAGTVGEYEISILREMLMGVELADTFGIGVTVSQNWEPVGLLPNTDVTEENAKGSADLLRVTIAK